MNASSDHELLVSLHENVERLVKAVEGNGQPGIQTRLAVLEGRATPPAPTKVAAFAGTTGAIIATMINLVLAKIGVHG